MTDIEHLKGCLANNLEPVEVRDDVDRKIHLAREIVGEAAPDIIAG